MICTNYAEYAFPRHCFQTDRRVITTGDTGDRSPVNFGLLGTVPSKNDDLLNLLNPRPAGPLDFPPPAGGGAFERPPPMISAPGRRREKRKAAFESSRKIISKSFRSFFGSGQNWGLQGSKFQNFPKRFFDNKIFNFKDRATNLIPSCLSR